MLRPLSGALAAPEAAGSCGAWRCAVAGAAMVILGGCAGATAADRGEGGGKADDLFEPVQAQADELPDADSGFGGYLAGRHARLENDSRAALQYFLRALADNPADPDLLGDALGAALAERDMDTALGLAERLLAVDEKNSLAILTLSVTAAARGDWDGVTGPLASMPESGLNRFMLPLLRAWAAAGKGDYDGAIAALEPLSGNTVFASTHDFHLGLLNEYFGHMQAAESGYASAMSALRGGSFRVVSAAGGFYQRAGRLDEARAIYDGFLDQNPDTTFLDSAYRQLDDGTPPPPLVGRPSDGIAEALYGVGISLFQENALAPALLYTQLALHLRPDLDVAVMLLGDLLVAAGQNDAAAEAYRAVPADSPLSWTVRLRRANALADLDRIDEAAAEFRAMARDRPERADPLIALADMLRRNERYEEAVEVYDQAIGRLPTLEQRHWSLLYARGMSLERSKQWARAEKDFLRALELEPDQPLVLNYLGYSWVEMGRNLDRARGMIEKAVEQRPNDGYIVDSLGWVLYRLGEYEDAAKYLERAAELKPNDPVILDHFGDSLWRVGRRSEARFQWRRALSFGPDDDLREVLDGKLQSGLPDKAVDSIVNLEDS